MTKQEAAVLGEPVVKNVVDCIAERKYDSIPEIAEIRDMTLEDFKYLIEEFLEINELPYIDSFDTECNFKPQYEYHQLNIYVYNNGTGFAADYALTTDGELNDLTLQMEFLFTEPDKLTARILDAHVL